MDVSYPKTDAKEKGASSMTQSEDSVSVFPLKTDVIGIGDRVVDAILKSLRQANLTLRHGDVLVITSKIVSYEQKRLVKLSDATPSKRAKELAKKFSLKPEYVELVLREADVIYGGADHVILTLKDSMLVANAGIDNKNSPDGWVALWPENLENWVSRFRKDIRQKSGANVGVLVIDSTCMPLRIGTVGIALAVSGFKPIKDHRGETDLYGKPIVITQHAVAHNLAATAHLVIGEAVEQTPAALVRGAPLEMNDETYGGADMVIPFDECFFAGALLDYFRENNKKTC